MRRCIAALVFLPAALCPPDAPARIELLLMEQARGLRPPPLEPEIRFRGTPFGHMALYVESAARDAEGVLRQARPGERGGLVLTVDKELRDSFFTAYTREEFFYGPLDPENLPAALSRGDIEKALEEFNRNYGHLYNRGPGVSGLGQDYGTLFVRGIRGFVYPTTRREEAAIIEQWREQRHDTFVPMTNNCVPTVIRAMNRAGLDRRDFFIRGLAPYNAWTYFVRRLLWAPPCARAPNGAFLRRDGAYLTHYPQIPSDAVRPAGRPFNVYSLQNLEYLVWAGPHGSAALPSDAPVSYRGYPSGKEKTAGAGPRRGAAAGIRWAVSQPEEFLRLWIQSFKGFWYLAGG
ncbi:MAG: hypothetical protein IT574_09585 [Candidatus Aureabacteria bacterium]|nr:hypothetical protein [Candidatus Auribacterota bacterium]